MLRLVRVAGQPGSHWLLVRRHQRTRQMAFYHCYFPRQVSLATLVKIAGRRWDTEESFQASNDLTGLDDHQARRWAS